MLPLFYVFRTLSFLPTPISSFSSFSSPGDNFSSSSAESALNSLGHDWDVSSELTAQALTCNAHATPFRSGDSSAGQQLYSLVVPPGRAQRLHLTTCGDETNVDTQVASFLDTVASRRAAFNDDDEHCGGSGKASTMEVDVSGGSEHGNGRLVFFSVAHSAPLQGLSKESGSTYELLLICEDLDDFYHDAHAEHMASEVADPAASGFSPAIYDSVDEDGNPMVGSVVESAARVQLKHVPERPTDNAPFSPEVFSAPAEWSEEELVARETASNHPVKPEDYMVAAVDLEGPEFRDLDQEFHTGYAYTPTFENSSKVFLTLHQTAFFGGGGVLCLVVARPHSCFFVLTLCTRALPFTVGVPGVGRDHCLRHGGRASQLAQPQRLQRQRVSSGANLPAAAGPALQRNPVRDFHVQLDRRRRGFAHVRVQRHLRAVRPPDGLHPVHRRNRRLFGVLGPLRLLCGG